MFAENQMVREFRRNAFFAAEDAPMSEAAGYRPELSGPIADKRDWTVADLTAPPPESQITRHVHVEG